MNAHRLVIAAAALTIAVTGMLASTLIVLNGQSLPQAVHNQVVGSSTTLTLYGPVNSTEAAQYNAMLPGQIKAAFDDAPVTVLHDLWSDPLSFTGAPAAPPGDGTKGIEAAAVDDITAHAALVSGTWPTAPVRGQPIPAALPATAAALLHLAPGDTARFSDTLKNTSVEFTITGLYRPDNPASPYWQLDTYVGLSGVTTSEGFSTYGPLTVQPSAFAANGPLGVSSGSWLAEPDATRIPAGQFSSIAGNIEALTNALLSPSSLPALTVTTTLPTTLSDLAAALDVARSLLDICAILLAMLAAATLLAVSRLLAGQREGETAMLIARGATLGQLVRLACVEAVPLCLLPAAAGAAAGIFLAGGLVRTGSRPASGTLTSALLAAIVVGVGALIIMLMPTLNKVTPGTTRARRGRQAVIAGVSRAGIDVALIVLAVLSCWQLRHYSAVSAGLNGSFAVDPVIVLAPALALAAATVPALRLLPAIGRATDRLAARGRRLTGALANWQISRQPLRQGGIALLIVLASATATLAFTQRASWVRSDQDQAAFQAGANVQVQPSQSLGPAQVASLTTAPGVRTAMPEAIFDGAVDNSDVLAIGAPAATNVVLLRPGQSPRPAAALFGLIGHAPALGLALPGTGSDLQVTMRLGPAALHLAPTTVSFSIQDAYGDVYQLAVTVPGDGQLHTYRLLMARVAYPLRLTALDMTYTLPATEPASGATLTIAGLSDGPGPGTAPLPGSALSALVPAVSSQEEVDALLPHATGMAGVYGLPGDVSQTASGATEAVTFGTGYGQIVTLPGAPPARVFGQLTLTSKPEGQARVIPGIATQSFLVANDTSVGHIVEAGIEGSNIFVRIVAVVGTFPTVTNPDGALIVNLATVQSIKTVGSDPPIAVTQWWLATAGHQQPRGLAASLPGGSVIISQAALAASLLDNPLSDIPQQAMLGIALAALLLACTGFCVSIATGVRQRRAENALLAALGVAPRTAATQLSLEKLMLSLPAAAIGLVIGVVLADLLVPAITLSVAGAAPVPPVLIEFGWVQSLGTAVILAVLPVLVAALVMVRRPDAAADLRSAEAA
jgi:FtsX-like permease family protein